MIHLISKDGFIKKINGRVLKFQMTELKDLKGWFLGIQKTLSNLRFSFTCKLIWITSQIVCLSMK